MKVYVVRHGQSQSNAQREFAGWSSTPLSELGRRQAGEIGAVLHETVFDAVYCSPLLRAQQTVEIVLGGRLPIYSEKIREINVGTLSGRRISDCRAEYGKLCEQAVRAQDFSAFGGETQAQIQERVFCFMQELEHLENIENVAVFCHEGVVHQMFKYVFEQDIMLRHLRIANVCVTVFSFEKGLWKLVRLT